MQKSCAVIQVTSISSLYTLPAEAPLKPILQHINRGAAPQSLGLLGAWTGEVAGESQEPELGHGPARVCSVLAAPPTETASGSPHLSGKWKIRAA